MTAHYFGPEFPDLVLAESRKELPAIGERIQHAIQEKIGVYQPGWSPLAESTLSKKSKRSRIHGGPAFSVQEFHSGLGMADRPLLDTGEMRQSIQHFEDSDSTHIVAGFPIGQHEQDSKIADFHIAAGIPLPARPVMWPTVEEQMGSIIGDVEERGARL
jgi:hypothetical protein